MVSRCIICEEESLRGIHICTSFICTLCEYNIIHTDARTAKYRYYVRKLKPINPTSLYPRQLS